MMKKLVLLAILFTVLCALSTAYAMGGKPPRGETATDSVEATDVSIQEWKTYTSKAGFSVTYPAEWYLWEERGTGWRVGPEGPPFGITDTNPDIGTEVVPEEKRMGIDFNVWSAPNDLPDEAREKLVYIAHKQQMALVDKIDIFEKNDILMCLAYGVPRGDSKKYYHLFFYIPQSNSVVFSNSGFAKKENVWQVLDKILFRLEE